MSHNKDIPGTNDGAFYMEMCILKMDRISMLCIVANLELALRHPDMPATTMKQTREIGKTLALRLIGDGIIVPHNIIESWSKTFGISPKDIFFVEPGGICSAG